MFPKADVEISARVKGSKCTDRSARALMRVQQDAASTFQSQCIGESQQKNNQDDQQEKEEEKITCHVCRKAHFVDAGIVMNMKLEKHVLTIEYDRIKMKQFERSEYRQACKLNGFLQVQLCNPSKCWVKNMTIEVQMNRESLERSRESLERVQTPTPFGVQIESRESLQLNCILIPMIPDS